MTKNRPGAGVSAKEYHSSQGMSNQVLAYQEAGYNFALQRTKNTEDASDLLQEATFKALKNHDKFTLGTNFKAWFFTHK